MKDIFNGIIIAVSGGTVMLLMQLGVHAIMGRRQAGADMCKWHQKNTRRLMYTVDAILDYIKREADKNGVKLNGRFERARASVDEFMHEDEIL